MFPTRVTRPGTFSPFPGKLYIPTNNGRPAGSLAAFVEKLSRMKECSGKILVKEICNSRLGTKLT